MDLNPDVSKNELRINAGAPAKKQPKGTKTATVIRNLQVKQFKPGGLDEKPPVVHELLHDELNYLQKIELEKQQKMQLKNAAKKGEAELTTQSTEGEEENLDETFINELDEENCK